MSFIEIFNLVVGAVTILMGISISPIAFLVWKIRTNDLHHIEASLETLKEGQMRIETALARHLEAHAEGRY